jgi:hypothetical protein
MSTRKNRTPAERTIIFGAVLGQVSLERLNELLHSVGARPLPPGSYRWVSDYYLPRFAKDWSRLGEAVESPPNFAKLREWDACDLPTDVSEDTEPTEAEP